MNIYNYILLFIPTFKNTTIIAFMIWITEHLYLDSL